MYPYNPTSTQPAQSSTNASAPKVNAYGSYAENASAAPTHFGGYEDSASLGIASDYSKTQGGAYGLPQQAAPGFNQGFGLSQNASSVKHQSAAQSQQQGSSSNAQGNRQQRPPFDKYGSSVSQAGGQPQQAPANGVNAPNMAAYYQMQQGQQYGYPMMQGYQGNFYGNRQPQQPYF